MLVHAAVILGAAFFAPDSGTEARAMGGTGVAFTETPIAVWYNPANLTGQTGIGILVDANVLLTSQTFARAGTNPDTPGDYPGAGEPYNSVDGEAPPQIIPALLGTYSLMDDKLTLAFGAVAPTGPRQRFPKDGPQRYNLFEQWLIQVNYGVWAGYEVSNWLSVGAGFEGLYNTVDQGLVASVAQPNQMPTEDPGLDLEAELKAASAFSPCGVLGVTVRPPRMTDWSFGLSYRLPGHIRAPGTIEFSSIITRPVDLDMEFSVPSLLRIGGGVNKESWSGSLDLVVENWTPHDEVLIDFDDNDPLVGPTPQTPLPTEIALVHNYGPAYSVRLGGAKMLGESLRLMGGYYFETSAVPTRYMGVDSYDNLKHGANVGVGYQIGATRVSLAYSYVYIQPRTVDDTEVRVLSPFAPDDSFTVANGDYSGNYNMMSLSVFTHF